MYVLFIVTFLSTLILKISCTTLSTSSEDTSKQVEQYTTEIVQNDKIRDVYINCLLDKGPCSNDANNIKKMLPEAVERGCAKCSEMHKKIIEKMMLHLKEKQPEILKQVTAKFDPKGEFMRTFLSKLQHNAINHSNENSQQFDPNGQNQNEQSTQPQLTQQQKPIKN